MIKEFLFLQSYSSFEGGAVGNILSQWEAMGFFSYVIPFLLIFALVFGILIQIRLFRDNKTINAIIALSVGLMALQFSFVPRFFSEIFPRLGIGLIVILIVIILTGLFANPEDKWQMYLMWGIGAIVVVIILVQTAGVTGWYSFFPWLGYNWPMALGVIAFIVIIAVIVASSRPKSTTEMRSPLSQLLRAAGEVEKR